MKKFFLFIALFVCSMAHAAQDGDYVYYKLRDIEDRLDALESRLSKLNKKIQQPIVESVARSTAPKTIESYDDEKLEIEIGGQDESNEVPEIQAEVHSKETIRIESTPSVGLDLKAAEREFYDDAFAALRENRIERAEKLFLEFMKKFPDSGLLSNAHYWLGEIYYAQKKYKDASFHFLSCYQLRPTGSKAPDSVLKMSLSLEKLGNTSGACATFMKLVKEFPQAHSDIKRRANIEITKLRCDNN